MGGLTIVGTGPGDARLLTLEAAQCLEEAEQRRFCAFGLPHAREVAAQVAPKLDVFPLETLFGGPDRLRPRVYEEVRV